MIKVVENIHLYIGQDRWSAGLGFACACYVQLLVSCEMGKALDDAVI